MRALLDDLRAMLEAEHARELVRISPESATPNLHMNDGNC